MPVFSVIIPVHNAENTICRCLDSLRVQYFLDFEVWMVENGSCDGSARLCREYAAQDSRFHFYSSGLSIGPSGARNVGLDRAQGEYITFVDSDDYVTPDYLTQLHCAFVEECADVVFFGYRQVTVDGEKIFTRVPNVEKGMSCLHTLVELSRQDMFGYAWIKAFRTKAVGSARFPEELDLMEDEVFACRFFQTERRIAVLQLPLYYYVAGNVDSLMGRTHPDFCIKLDEVYRAWTMLLDGYVCGAALLRERAETYMDKCMYYGFEREVATDAFFKELSQCGFFENVVSDSAFYRAVKIGDIRSIRRMRSKYRLKIAAARLLGR